MAEGTVTYMHFPLLVGLERTTRLHSCLKGGLPHQNLPSIEIFAVNRGMFDICFPDDGQ
jgi:hypothetical protein